MLLGMLIQIYKQLGMPSSVGVSFNKFFAKMGSDFKKPLGFTIINKNNYNLFSKMC